MKIKIINQANKENGIEIISPLLGHNIFNLDNVADSECSEIECWLTNKIPADRLGQTIANYVSKLRHGATIRFIGIDLMQTCLAVVNRRLTIAEANSVIYGGPEVFNMNSSMVCANDIAAILQQFGINVTKKSLSGGIFTVEGERP